MKHFMMPRNQILRENHEAVAASPNPKSKPTTPNPSSRKLKSSKENAPPTPASDPNVGTSSPATKMKSPLPPRPPLKRKLSVESTVAENCGGAANSLDSGVKVVLSWDLGVVLLDGKSFNIRSNYITSVSRLSHVMNFGKYSVFVVACYLRKVNFGFSIAKIVIVRVRPPNNDEEDGGNSDIFELVGAPLVENCLAGFNSSVFAYGQTGSGKTYTIGSSNALLEENQQGLAPRVFHRLFERIEEEQVKQADRQLVYMCRCSFLEIREDVKTGVYVENLREECVSSMKDVSQLLTKGLSNRRTSATRVNAESSRSHSVFTCVVESRSKSAADGLSRLKMSRINFVDLAGSERQKQTGAAGERLKEAGNINRSLSQLGSSKYKHERECNAIIGQTREDKIARLESLMDGILPTEEFMEEELLSLTHEHKILQEQYDNHPDVLRTNIELKRIQEELERYQNFFDLGERDVLLEEIQDLRTQLQFYLDSSSKTPKKQNTPLLQLTSSCEPSMVASLFTAPDSTGNSEETLRQERIQWTEAESKWISLTSEDQDGIEDVTKAATRAGVRGAESKFINALAAEISALKVEREKERRYFRDENKGLQAQLRDTAEAVQAAGELLVRLKEAEEAVAAAEKRARMAEQETENAYKEMDKLNKLLAASHMPKEEFSAEDTAGAVADQQWREEFAPSYGVEEPSSWFSGYDRCNI
ncbi:UNVERIFIED_CONTAM: Kinesin-like protein KIN-12B [Sesamum angustifolium]|uniref:Kinesin-like protein n=1 Tax=Sesamum angustifolium TaxID=2727405 RepID=A0AAW2PUF4_9LAMI